MNLKEEDEDEVITQIKTLASEIFDYDLEGVGGMGIQLGLLSLCNRNGNGLRDKMRNYSYTERGPQQDRQECQSEWISYENFQKLNNLQSNERNQECKPQPVKDKIPNKNKESIAVEHPKSPTRKNFKKEIAKKSQKPSQQKISQIESKSPKIRLENLQEYGFMKQTNKLKKEIINEMYKKKQEAQEEIAKPKKHFKTLEELYGQKEPLYDKYLKDKQKKNNAIYQSRISEEQKLEEINPNPQINRNIPVEGSFEDRLKEGLKKSQHKKSKIMSEVLQGSTFHPQTNKTTKYKQVQSVVKGTWEKKKVSTENSKVSLTEQRTSKQNKSSRVTNFKLGNAYELTKILQIDDNVKE